MQKPPPLPAEVLARVLRASRIDGVCLVFIAGGFAVISALCYDWPGALVGGLAAGAGLIELRGRRKLQSGDIRGVKGLVYSQFVLLTVILLYVGYQLVRFDPQPMLDKFETSLASAQHSLGLDGPSLAELLGVTHSQLLVLARQTTRISYLAVAVISVLYQGGLAFYYHRREATLVKALRKN